MDGKWKIFVSYKYEIETGFFQALIEVKDSPNYMAKVIVYNDTLQDRLTVRSKTYYKLNKLVSKILEETKQQIESLRYSIDDLPENETYIF